MWKSVPPRVLEGCKTLQDENGERDIGSPIPPGHDSFNFNLRSMYHQGHPWIGTYLDVRRYSVINARTDAPRRYGARLGFFDVAVDDKIPWSDQQFMAEVRHRPFPGCPDRPASPVSGHSFCGAYWSTLSRRLGIREKESSTTLP
jgi:hypothetical protein